MWTRSSAVVLVLGLLLVGSAVGAMGAASLVGALGSGTSGSQSQQLSGLPSANPMIMATLTISPQQVTEGSSIQVTTTASGGNPTPMYSYQYFGLPSGCNGYTSASFQCDPSSSGTYNDIYVVVTDNNGNTTNSNTVSLDVTSSSGSGNGNGGSGGNNSSNPLSSLLSGFNGVLSLVLIVAIIGFVTWILLIVGVWIIAVVLIRRLPKRGAPSSSIVTPAAMKCASCSASIPTGTKFCPECGAATATKT
jgi:hypothetical protein